MKNSMKVIEVLRFVLVSVCFYCLPYLVNIKIPKIPQWLINASFIRGLTMGTLIFLVFPFLTGLRRIWGTNKKVTFIPLAIFLIVAFLGSNLIPRFNFEIKLDSTTIKVYHWLIILAIITNAFLIVKSWRVKPSAEHTAPSPAAPSPAASSPAAASPAAASPAASSPAAPSPAAASPAAPSPAAASPAAPSPAAASPAAASPAAASPAAAAEPAFDLSNY